jgi:hypothetical protein
MGEQAVEDGLAIPLRSFASHLTAPVILKPCSKKKYFLLIITVSEVLGVLLLVKAGKMYI